MPPTSRRRRRPRGKGSRFANNSKSKNRTRRREQAFDSDGSSSYISSDNYNDDTYICDKNSFNRRYDRCFMRRRYSQYVSINKLLVLALLVFAASQLSVIISDFIESIEEARVYDQVRNPIRQHTPTQNRPSDSIWDANLKSFGNVFKKKKKNLEAMHSYCKPTDWQTTHFVTCSLLHEHDLQLSLGNFNNYIGAGLWRSVWSITGFDESNKAVLKIMRNEHEVNDRNFDRHRRDAVVMDVLAGNQNVVSTFGFCGNSVITEYVGSDLSSILEPQKKSLNNRTWKGIEDQGNTDRGLVYTFTITKKLELSIDIAKGVAALHNLNGPVLHADIGSKQFLMDPLTKKVKINDFNRCRFLPIDIRNKGDAKYCSVRIPSSPGKFRSPEEYGKQEITEKADIFSLGHVFFGILHGIRSIDYVTVKHKSLLFDGKVNTGDLEPKEIMFAKLIEKMFERDPNDRPSARDIVSELERIKSKS